MGRKLNEQPICNVDSPNMNGIIYPREEIVKMLEKLKNNDNPVLGTIGYGDRGEIVNLDSVAFKCENFKIKKDKVVCDINVLENDRGKMINDLVDTGTFCFGGHFKAKLKEDKTTEDMSIISVACISSEAVNHNG